MNVCLLHFSINNFKGYEGVIYAGFHKEGKRFYQLSLGIIASGIGFVHRPADVFAWKRSANAASATDVFCAKAQRQQQQQQQQQHEGRHDVGHFGNATGRGFLPMQVS